MATMFSASQPNPCVAVVRMTRTEDGIVSRSWLHCGIPGGTPVFSLSDPGKTTNEAFRGMQCTNAPTCDSKAELLAFAKARFTDEG